MLVSIGCIILNKKKLFFTCSVIGAVVGFTISFCTTAIRTTRGARVSSLAAVNRKPFNSKLPAPASCIASCGSSRILRESTFKVGRLQFQTYKAGDP